MDFNFKTNSKQTTVNIEMGFGSLEDYERDKMELIV
jgi:hypothetical protein